MPACCNPDHLTIGTRVDQALDRRRDGTQPMGEKHERAKISEQTATKVLLSKGKGTQAQRAEKFGVTAFIVRDIDIGRNWKHLREHPANEHTQETKSNSAGNEAVMMETTHRTKTAMAQEAKTRKKTSEETVIQIMRSKGKGTQHERATKYGTTLSVVEKIDAGQSWQKLRAKFAEELRSLSRETQSSEYGATDHQDSEPRDSVHSSADSTSESTAIWKRKKPKTPSISEETALKIMQSKGQGMLLTAPRNMEFTFPWYTVLTVVTLGRNCVKRTAPPFQ